MPIPDINTFSLQDVVNDVGGNDLKEAFNNSNALYFDPTIVPSGFDPDAADKSGYELLYFRNYGQHQIIDTDPDGYGASNNQESFSLDVLTGSGEDWSFIIDPSPPSGWISVSQNSGTGTTTGITVSIEANDGAERSGYIDAFHQATGITARCNISQLAFDDSGGGTGETTDDFSHRDSP